MTPKLKKIILLILIVIIAFVAYVIFLKKDPEVDSLIKTTPTNQNVDTRLLGTQITQALYRIEQIKLNKDIFTSEVYLSLQDKSRPIADEPTGRANPFAPIGTISATSSIRMATTTRPATTTPNITNQNR